MEAFAKRLSVVSRYVPARATALTDGEKPPADDGNGAIGCPPDLFSHGDRMEIRGWRVWPDRLELLFSFRQFKYAALKRIAMIMVGEQARLLDQAHDFRKP